MRCDPDRPCGRPGGPREPGRCASRASADHQDDLVRLEHQQEGRGQVPRRTERDRWRGHGRGRARTGGPGAPGAGSGRCRRSLRGRRERGRDRLPDGLAAQGLRPVHGPASGLRDPPLDLGPRQLEHPPEHHLLLRRANPGRIRGARKQRIRTGPPDQPHPRLQRPGGLHLDRRDGGCERLCGSLERDRLRRLRQHAAQPDHRVGRQPGELHGQVRHGQLPDRDPGPQRRRPVDARGQRPTQRQPGDR